MVNISFRFSTDYKSWTSLINGKSIEEYALTGSYDVRQGYNLSDIPRASTFSLQLVMDFELSKALMEYKYIKIFKDGEMTFTGVLSPESQRDIETLNSQLVSVKYTHLLGVLENTYFGADDFELNIDSTYDFAVLDNAHPEKSLVHILVNAYLFRNNELGFTFENEYENLTKVVSFGVVGRDNVWEVLNKLLLEYGYRIRIDNLTLRTVDILKPKTSGTELLDGADISVKNSNVDMSLPEVQYLAVEMDRDVTLYTGNGTVGGFLWWPGTVTDDLEFSFKRENDGVKMQNVTNVRYTNSDEGDTVESYTYLNPGKRSLHRSSTYKGTGFTTFHEEVVADVTYSVYKTSVSSSVKSNGRTVQAKYLYAEDQVERYLRSLNLINQFKKTEWTFYSKVKLHVDDIIRFKDIPDSTCRIFEVQDTLEADGGYTYRAFPFSDSGITFTYSETEVNPSFATSVTDISSTEPIFIEDGKYKKPTYTIAIRTDNFYLKPVVTVDGVVHQVYYDGNLKSYAITVTPTDTDKEFLEVIAIIDPISFTYSVPVFKVVNGKDYPPIVQYAYSNNTTVPDLKNSVFGFANSIFNFKTSTFLSGGINWSTEIPSGEQYKGMYLWKRTWSYELNKWIYERLTGDKGADGTPAELFAIYPSSLTYLISKRLIASQKIYIRYEAQNIDGNISMTTSFGEIGAYDADQWMLELPAYTPVSAVVISAVYGKYKQSIMLTGVEQDLIPLYFGKRDNPPTPEEAKVAKFIEGDYYLNTSNIPYRYDGISEWNEVTAADTNYNEIMYSILADAFSDEKSVIPSQSVIWQFVRNLVASNATIENLVSRNVKVGKGNENTGFYFRASDYSDGNEIDPVFEVMYNGKVIFKVSPKNGNIFFGEPKKPIDPKSPPTEPKSGFMYNAASGSIVSANNRMMISSSGDITAEDATLKGDSVFQGAFDCTAIKTEKSNITTQDIKMDASVGLTRVYGQFSAFVKKMEALGYSQGRKIRCSIKENPNVHWMSFEVTGHDIAYVDYPTSGGSTTLFADIGNLNFYDKNLNWIKATSLGVPVLYYDYNNFEGPVNYNVLKDVCTLGASHGTNQFYMGWCTWIRNPLNITLFSGGNSLVVSIPEAPSQAEINKMEHGQLYVLSDGTVKMKF